VDVSGQRWPVTASVGLAVDSFRVGTPGPAELLGLARQALHEAKMSGKDRFCAIGLPGTQLPSRTRTTS
jgi:PleD family two-component response regulator